MKDNRSGIYKIVNSKNGKHYVGSAQRLHSRWLQHRNALRANRHDNPKLQRAWDKYGEACFEFVVIELVPDEGELIPREQYWIDTLDACNGDIGYNICPVAGRTAGVKRPYKPRGPFSDETRKRMSIAATGKKMSEAACAKMSASQLGKTQSAESRKKKSDALKGRAREPFSDEWRGNLKAAAKNRPPPSPDTVAKRAATLKAQGRKMSPDNLAKLIAANTGAKRSDESRARMSAAGKARAARQRAEKLQQEAADKYP